MVNNKYKNRKTVVDNITFDSMKEAARYGELKLLNKAGKLDRLELQPVIPININGKKVCVYKGDFQYRIYVPGPDKKKPWLGAEHKTIVEDVKGVKTPVYRLKKKLVKALYDIDIQEI